VFFVGVTHATCLNSCADWTEACGALALATRTADADATCCSDLGL